MHAQTELGVARAQCSASECAAGTAAYSRVGGYPEYPARVPTVHRVTESTSISPPAWLRVVRPRGVSLDRMARNSVCMTEHCADRARYARNTAVAADAHAATAEAQAQARAASERIDAVRAECAGECEAIGDRCAHSRARACSACTAVHSLRIARRKKRASLFGCLLLCHRGLNVAASRLRGGLV